MSSTWPAIEDGYYDPEGYIDLDVYNAAGALWEGGAEMLALKMHQDEATGRQLLLKAVARVTKRRAGGGKPITDLKYYLLRTYINLLKERLKRLKRAEPYDDAAFDAPVESFAPPAEKLIDVREKVGQMDDSTREIFELHVLGYTFEEIGRGKGVSAAAIRAKFHRQRKRLAESLTDVTTAGGGASLDEPVT